jgi:calreticulin
VNGEVYFKETFDSTWEDRWASSGDGKFTVSAGKHYGDEEKSKGLQTSQDARFYHISAVHPEFSNKGKDLVVSLQVKHEQDIDCGGGYVKLTPAGLDQEKFNGDTDYNIMFGPDICGATKKVHVILNYKGKNVLINKDISCMKDVHPHTYTLVLKPDQTYEVLIDGESKQTGELTADFDFLAPKEIKDPEVSKPEDWVDEALIDDPEDIKPEDWDQPKTIDDPDAEKPDDWDDEDDGEWEPPQIDNPDYKGEWSAKRISNPDYKGSWVHPMVPNPEFEDDKEIYAFDSFGGVGIDIWQVKSGTIFDNIILADSLDEVNAFIESQDDTEGTKAAWQKDEDEKKAKAEAEAKAAEEARAAEEDDDDDDDDDDVEDAIKAAKEEL